jgi:hypothetical protein
MVRRGQTLQYHGLSTGPKTKNLSSFLPGSTVTQTAPHSGANRKRIIRIYILASQCG